MRITFDDGGTQARVEGIRGALDDLRPWFGDVHDIFLAFEKKVFASQGGYSGEQWQALSPMYAAWKKRNAPGKTMMHLSERLYPSLTSKSHEDHVYETGPSWMEVGTRTLYARAQHFGYEPANLPARPLIPKMTKAEGERMVDALLAHILKAARTGRRGGR